IKKFYPHEYHIGLEALRIIKDYTEVQLEEDEAGFFAFHVVGSSLNNHSSSTQEIMNITKEIMSIVEKHYQTKLRTDSIYYIRFITHIKYFLYRLLSNDKHKQDDTSLYHVIKKEYYEEYKCVKKIFKFLQNKYNYLATKEELGYLMLHIKSMISYNEER